MPETPIKCISAVDGIAFEFASLSCVEAKYTSVIATIIFFNYQLPIRSLSTRSRPIKLPYLKNVGTSVEIALIYVLETKISVGVRPITELLLFRSDKG